MAIFRAFVVCFFFRHLMRNARAKKLDNVFWVVSHDDATFFRPGN